MDHEVLHKDMWDYKLQKQLSIIKEKLWKNKARQQIVKIVKNNKL